MEKEAPRPRATKELLIQGSVRRLGARYRQEFVSGFLSGRTGLPVRWLNPEQVVFVELEADSTLDPRVRAAALDLAARVGDLGDLVFALLDDFSQQQETVYDRNQRAKLRRGSGPALICRVLFRRFRTWPPADPRQLGRRVRREIDRVLHAAVPQKRDGSPNGPTTSWPGDDRALAVWDRTRATDDPDKLKRYIVLDLVEAFVKTAPGLIATATLAIVYLGLFLALRHFTPELTTHEDMIVAGAAITAALGGSGAMLAGQALRARVDGRGRAGPKAGARRPGGAE
jgi:hypothetical protein